MTVHDLLPRLPGPSELRGRSRAMAVLDAVFNAKYPRHLFIDEWRPGVALAQMDNGSGDVYVIAFDPAGVFLYGFDHESPVSPWAGEDHELWPGLLDGLPEALAGYPTAFQDEDGFDATVCAWWTPAAGWACGPVAFDDAKDEDDGAGWLFSMLTAADPAAAYAGWASHYFGAGDAARVATVAWAFAGEPLTRDRAEDLKPGHDWDGLVEAARAMGYPVG